MKDEYLASRWYDEDPCMSEILDVMQDLPKPQQEELSATVIQLVNMIRRNKTDEEAAISIGKNRVLGLYKSFNRRRWYDKSLALMSAMNVISTLPIEDSSKITEGLLLTISGEPAYD